MGIRFGATTIQFVPYPALRDDVRFAEEIRLDNAWVIDQFGIDGAPEVPMLEAWTTLGALAADTSTIRVGSMVTNVAMRNPGVLATSILTVDQISDGRLDVAVGGGFYPTEHHELGIDFLDARGRGDRLREAVAILDRALRGETVTEEGEHFSIRGATFRPMPTQRPRPPLWVAAQATKSLRVAIAHADAVVTLGEQDKGVDESLPAFATRMERLDELCVEAGRDPASLRRCYFAGWADEPFFASTDAMSDLVGRYTEAGATDFTFYLANPDDDLFEALVDGHRAATRDQMATMATGVFPTFRD
jgi:alkanesulfonate monooxygenase SsuD/methylene tetrahydromethanopterin reductase-like flavin-dependent oxidoreductase (luciferase family)